MTSRRQRPAVSGKGKSQVPANNDDYDDDDEYDEEEEAVKRSKSKDDRILCFVPSEGIDLDVIRATIPIQSFLGPKASVSHGKHPTVRPKSEISPLFLADCV